LKWAGHVARNGGQAKYIQLFVGVVNERDSLEDLAVDVRISQCKVQKKKKKIKYNVRVNLKIIKWDDLAD
jgi:hypothetical protein